MTLPYGLIGFRVSDVQPGGVARVDLTLPKGASADGYWKQDPHTGSLGRFDFDGQTGAVVRGNAITLYLRDGGRGDDDGKVNGVVVDPGGPGYGGSFPVVVGAQVTQVNFSGPDFITIEADPGTPSYSGPHWLDTEGDGIVEQALPIGYPRGTDLVVSARFAATIQNYPFQPPPQTLLVRAFSSAETMQPTTPFQVPATAVTLEGNELYLPPTTVVSPFPDCVNYGTLGFNWQFSGDGGATWTGAGTTANELYVTLATPLVSPVYHTVIHLPSLAAYGMGDGDSTIDKVWEKFASLNVTTHKNERLHYYRNWDVKNSTIDKFTAELLEKKDGQCMAWTTFFLDALATEGIATADNYVILRPNEGSDLVVANWNFVGAGTSGKPAFPYRNTLKTPTDLKFMKKVEDGKWVYEWGNVEEVQDQPGIKGQGTDNPRALFGDHIVAQLNGKVYDPSYGLKFDSVQKLEDGEILGFASQDVLTDVGPNGEPPTFIVRFKKNPAGADVNVTIKTYKNGKTG